MIALLQFFTIVLVAPFIAGVMQKTKSILRGSYGPALLQPYYNIYKLLQKEVVLSETSSYISKIAPYIVAIVPISVAAFLPVFDTRTLLSFSGDIIAMVYILALGTFFLALFGFDQGSSFGGLGSSREMTVASLAEPAFIMVVFTFALQSNSTNISHIFYAMKGNIFFKYPVSSILALMALYFVTLAESGRIPIDNPETHLELTMIHEAMILDASGRHLALLEIGSFVKTAIFLTLISNIFMPFGFYDSTSIWTIIVSIFVYFLKMCSLAIIIATGELTLAKLRYFRISDAMMFGFVLALISMITYRL
jgi:formate hydrogenlyase subunit 4